MRASLWPRRPAVAGDKETWTKKQGAMAPQAGERAYEWDLVSIVEDRGRNKDPRVNCSYCGKDYTGGVTRIRAHILGNKSQLGVAKCQGEVPAEVVDRLKLAEEAKEREAQRKRRREQLQRAASGAQSTLSASKSGTQSSIQAAFARADKSEVDAAVARCFYANGIPFNVARNPFFKDAVAAIAAAGPGYKPPSSETLRTTLLEREKESLSKDINSLLEAQLEKTGVSVNSDGWSNTSNRPLLNILLVTPTMEVFEAAVDTSGERKSGQYIAEQLISVIEKVRS